MIKELKSKHRSICQMSFNGFSNNEIAEKYEMTAATISQILRSPLGQAYIGGLDDRVKETTLDVRKQLIQMNAGALETIERMLDIKKNAKVPFNVQFAAAKDVLDRNGYKAPDKFNIDMTLQGKSDEEIDAEIRAMEKAIARTQGAEIAAAASEAATNNIEGNKSDASLTDLALRTEPIEPGEDFFNPFEHITDL